MEKYGYSIKRAADFTFMGTSDAPAAAKKTSWITKHSDNRHQESSKNGEHRDEYSECIGISPAVL